MPYGTLDTTYGNGATQVQTTGPGVSVPGAAGLQLGALGNFLGQAMQYKMSLANKARADQSQMEDRKMRLAEQEAAQKAADQQFQQNFSYQQWKALQDKQNEEVPVYTNLPASGFNMTGGYYGLSDTGGPGKVLAGYMRADRAPHIGTANLAPSEHYSPAMASDDLLHSEQTAAATEQAKAQKVQAQGQQALGTGNGGGGGGAGGAQANALGGDSAAAKQAWYMQHLNEVGAKLDEDSQKRKLGLL